MAMKTYKKYVELIKSTGICIVMVGGCWFLYQLRQMSQIFESSVPTNVLTMEHKNTQYIYIDDPRFKDMLMLRKIENLQSSVPDQTLSFSHTIMKWWKSLNRSTAYKLLHMAKNSEGNDRMKALYDLNSSKHLKDWHYQHIAQMLDARNAVSLARMPNVDKRFFLRPPYSHVQHRLPDVIEKMYQLLLSLSSLCKNTHPCLTQFLNKRFKDTHSDSLILDHDLTSLGLVAAPAKVWNHELLQSCIQALCHHSCLDECSKDIVEAGGLPLLMIVKKMFNGNIDVCTLLAKIMSNISLHSEYLEDIFQAGWIGALVEWSQSSDVTLSVSASRALANLDADENAYVKYPRSIYPLHPLCKTRTKQKLDVIFLHGLLGGVFVTWRQRDLDTPQMGVIDPYIIQDGISTFSSLIGDQSQEFLKDLTYDMRKREWDKIGQDFEVVLDDCPENANDKADGPFFCSGSDPCMKKIHHDSQHRTKCWPKDWLPQDVPYLRVIGVNYDTNLSMWTPSCPIEGIKTTMNKRSKEYLRELFSAGVGKRAIVWVCHSMGGLLVKKMLVDEWKDGDKHGICKNTRSIVFYSTPHRGSRVAALKQAAQMVLWPSVEVQELREGSPELLALHAEFLNMLKEHPIEVVSFSETKSTYVTPFKVPLQFVTSNSADPGVGEFYEIAQDHLSICKPTHRHSFLYKKLSSVLKRHVMPPENASASPFMELLSLPSKLF